MSFFKKFFSREKEQDLDQGLEKTKESFLGKISRAITGKSIVDEATLDELEDALISSDVGLETTVRIINRLKEKVADVKYTSSDELQVIIRDVIIGLLDEKDGKQLQDFELDSAKKPYVLLVVGVNGVGKTTTIGKLAYQYNAKGYKVVIGAGDTFRAAAVDQLKIWADRVGCHFFSKGMNTDPAAVAYETVQYAIQNNLDMAIIDTAGRLHTKTHLMQELNKIKRSIEKSMPGAPHDVLLVLDATTGQNALEQCKQFTEVTDVTELVLTKLDGTAKGGVAIGISDQFNIPIRYIGVGESITQLQVFNKQAFVNSLFK